MISCFAISNSGSVSNSHLDSLGKPWDSCTDSLFLLRNLLKTAHPQLRDHPLTKDSAVTPIDASSAGLVLVSMYLYCKGLESSLITATRLAT